MIATRERNYLLKIATNSKDLVDWKKFRQKRNSVNRLKNYLKLIIVETLFVTQETILKGFGKC